MADKKISQLPQGSIINDNDEMVMVQANNTKRFNASLLKTFIGSIAKGNLTESTSSVLTIGNGTNAVIGTGTTIQVKQASALQDGFISSSDYTSFSSKEPALTKGSLTESTSGVLTITGGTSAVIGSGTTIQVKQASASQNGYLSSTNWSTFNGKQDSITGGATTITTSNLTALRAVASDASGKVAVSATTSTELGYVSGVTSAIQTQLNAKQGSLTLTTTGTSGAATLVGSTLNIPQYSGGGSYTFSTGLTNTSGTVTSNLSVGVSGGQSVIGGTAASNSLTLSSTSNATKGKILFGTSAYDEVNNRLGIGTASPSYAFDVVGTGTGNGQSLVRFTNPTNFNLNLALNSTGTTGNTNFGFTVNDVTQGAVGWDRTDNSIQFWNAIANASYVGMKLRSDGNTSFFRVSDGSENVRFVSSTGNVLIGTTTDAGFKLNVNGTVRSTQFYLSALNTAPATASSTGTLGEIRIDASYIYVCTATNTWKRSQIATW